jgi:type II secretory pathway pseudopilin PulG
MQRGHVESIEPASRRAGFTIVECLTAIGVVGLLLALLLPAVVQSREASRRLECATNLKQLGIALHNYLDVYGRFPQLMDGDQVYVALLPYLEQHGLYEQIREYWVSKPSPKSMDVRVYVCPSETVAFDEYAIGPGYYPNYLMNEGSGKQKFGDNGFNKWYGARPADFTDGLSNTAALCEKLIHTHSMGHDGELHAERRFWAIPAPLQGPNQLDAFADACRNDKFLISSVFSYDAIGIVVPNAGYNHILPPNAPSCWNGPTRSTPGSVAFAARTASSLHRSGVNLLMGDGRCTFVSENIDVHLWRAVASRNGNDVVGEF